MFISLFSFWANGQDVEPKIQPISIFKAIPPNVKPEEPIGPGVCTPEADGKEGHWKFKKINASLRNSVNYFWLGRNPDNYNLESIGLELPCSDTLDIPILFIRLFKKSNSFLCFTALGKSGDIVRLEAIKNEFYENINP